MERISVSTGQGLFDFSNPLLSAIWTHSGPTLILMGGIVLALSFLLSLLKRILGVRGQGRPRGRANGVHEFTPGNFTVKSLVNKSERRLHRDLTDLVPAVFSPQARLHTQVSLGAILHAQDARDWHTIRGKYVDFLVTSGSFEPLCVIEYQGTGHFGHDRDSARDARRRDWEKRRALRLANLPLIEVPAEYDRALLVDLLGDVTGRRPAGLARNESADLPAEA